MRRARLAAIAIGSAALTAGASGLAASSGSVTGGAGVARAATAPASSPAPSARVVFFDAAGPRPPAGPGLSPVLISTAEQAGYSRAQFLLDASQGARVGAPAYTPQR